MIALIMYHTRGDNPTISRNTTLPLQNTFAELPYMISYLSELSNLSKEKNLTY